MAGNRPRHVRGAPQPDLRACKMSCFIFPHTLGCCMHCLYVFTSIYYVSPGAVLLTLAALQLPSTLFVRIVSSDWLHDTPKHPDDLLRPKHPHAELLCLDSSFTGNFGKTSM